MAGQDDKNGGIASKVANFIVEKPWRALLVGALVLMAAMPGGQHIYADFSYRVWFNESDPLIQQFDAFERRFGNDESVMLMVHSPSGIFDKESAEFLTELTDRMWKADSVIRVDSLANFNWTHSEEDELIVEPLIPDDLPLTPELLEERKKIALAHETLPDYMVSRDGTVALLYAALKPQMGGSTNYQTVVASVNEVIKEFSGRGDHTIYHAGSPLISDTFREAAQTDLATLLPIVFGLVIFLLIVVFRRVSGLLLPLVVIGTSIMATMTLSGWMGFSINNMTSIVPQIVLAIAIADAVHVLTNYYRALRDGAPRKEAAYFTLKKNFVPTVVTTLSTTLGFLSFSTADVVPIGQLGILAGAGTVLAWIFTYFVMGPLLTLLPIKDKKARTEKKEDLLAPTERGIRAAGWVRRRRGPIFAVYALLFGASVVFLFDIKVNADPLEYFPPDSMVKRSSDFLEEKVGGSIVMEMVVDSGEKEGIKDPAFMKRVEAFQDYLESKPYTTSTTSIVDILKSTHKALHGDKPEFYKLPEDRELLAQEYLLYTMSLPQGMDLNDRVTLDNSSLRLTANWNIHDSATVLAAIDDAETKAKEMGLNVWVTGKVPLWQRMNPYVVDTFVTSIIVAVTLMSLLLIIVFRSFTLGLLALIPNGFPLVLGAAIISALDKPLDMGTTIIFSVCLGIAVDDTVHFLANFNRLVKEGYSRGQALARTFSHTMPALIFTTIILVLGFGAFAFADFMPNQTFGIMVALILLFALITDGTLLPAILGGKSQGPGVEVAKDEARQKEQESKEADAEAELPGATPEPA